MPASMAAMVCDMEYQGKSMGKIQFPAIKLGMNGGPVTIPEQEIKILDMEAFKSFVKAVMTEDMITVKLANGQCELKAAGLTVKFTYNKEVQLKGMMGPKSVMVDSRRQGDGICNTLKISNPSPVEVQHGDSVLEIINTKGEVMAELEGDLQIVRGEFEFITAGSVNKGVSITPTARLVGKRVKDGTWADETIKALDTKIALTPQFAALLAA
jgi:hypothetical protein